MFSTACCEEGWKAFSHKVARHCHCHLYFWLDHQVICNAALCSDFGLENIELYTSRCCICMSSWRLPPKRSIGWYFDTLRPSALFWPLNINASDIFSSKKVCFVYTDLFWQTSLFLGDFFWHAEWRLCKFSQFLSQSHKTWLALNSRSSYQLSFSSSAFFFEDSNRATSFSGLTGSSGSFFCLFVCYGCWSVGLTASLISPFLHPSYCCTWQFNSIKKHLVHSVSLSLWKKCLHSFSWQCKCFLITLHFQLLLLCLKFLCHS